MGTRQLVGAHEGSNDDHFWQLGITRRNDECFLASSKAVKHIDLRVRVHFHWWRTFHCNLTVSSGLGCRRIISRSPECTCDVFREPDA